MGNVTDSEDVPNPCAIMVCLPSPPATTKTTSLVNVLYEYFSSTIHFLSSFLPPLSPSSTGTRNFHANNFLHPVLSQPSLEIVLACSGLMITNTSPGTWLLLDPGVESVRDMVSRSSSACLLR